MLWNKRRNVLGPAAKRRQMKVKKRLAVSPWRRTRVVLQPLEERILLSTVQWSNPAGGDWDTLGNWMGGALPGPGDNVVINALNAGASITHALNNTDAVNSVTAAAPIRLSGGAVSVAGVFSDSSAITLAGGTLTNTTIALGTTITATSNSTLTGVTLAGELDINSLSGNGAVVTVTVDQGLTLANGTVQLSGSSNSGGSTAALVLAGAGTQTLGGTGQINFAADPGHASTAADQVYSNAGALTLGAGISVVDSNGSGTLGSSAQALTINGTVTASGGQTIAVTGSSVINIGPGGPSPSLEANGGTLAVTNLQDNTGGLSATGGGAETLAGAWQNTGTITENGATLNLGGAMTIASLGTLRLTGGTVNLGGTITNDGTLGALLSGAATVILSGTITNTGQTLALPNSGTAWNLNGGTVTGGMVSIADHTRLTAAYSTLNGVTLTGELDINSLSGNGVVVTVTVNQGLTLNNGVVQLNATSNSGGSVSALVLAGTGTQTLGGTGQVVFTAPFFPAAQSDQLYSSAGPLTLGSGISVVDSSGSGTVGTPSQALTIDGTVTASAGQTIIVTGSSVTNSGTITENAATLNLEGVMTTASLGTLSLTGGTVYLGGTITNDGTLGNLLRGATFLYLTGILDNTGSTLALNDSTGSLYLEGGTIDGGIVTTAGSAELVGTALGGTLAGVTLEGTLLMASPLLPVGDAGQVTVTGGLTLNGGSIDFSESANLTFQGNQALSGTGTVTFNNETDNNGLAVPSGTTLTIASGVTVQGNSGLVGSGTGGLLVNQGTIAASGGALTVQGETNFAGGTLTGGTWQASGGGSLDLLGAAITTNAANILLDGATSRVILVASRDISGLLSDDTI